MAMIDAAERAGLLKPGGTIVEPTSGNTGVGLAIVAAQRGYKCVFVMTDKVAPEKIALLRAYGAEVVVCPVAVAPEDPQSYYSTAERLVREIPGVYPSEPVRQPGQPAGPRRRRPGPRSGARPPAGSPTSWPASAPAARSPASAATSSRRTRDVQIIGADPRGLGVLRWVGPAVHGRGRRRGLLARDLRPLGRRPRDRRERRGVVPHGPTRRAARRASSSAARAASRSPPPYASRTRRASDDIVVVLVPDSGRGYLSRVFNDDWMADYGFLRTCDLCVAAVLDARSESLPPLIYVNPERHRARGGRADAQARPVAAAR